ncbi:serine/threonine protein phosphatase [Actinokineospora fastidiosa]|uniref:Serine/threonine protein phosphatase n=1 Tax=Actinokineospora fastidiosa TaxID=1816 RepID=A0A918G2P3_9PSEU|nr:diadenosine tetraphosphatase [Actinokineospora sp. UTMC 2448]GGS15702.1 serine/threonine protein phosphatase [Actinokineospora fastidiosa]
MVSAVETYVVGDVHGHRAELAAALRGRGLLDERDAWAGGTAHLWFLGDFVDRGPDGIGVIDLVMSLSEQAREQGGRVETLLGNHEILLLGMRRFGETEVPSDFGPRSFARSWEMNGGLRSDQDGLTDAHVAWLVERPVLALVGDHLLMHSDTLEYLAWGEEIEEINATVRAILRSDDIVEWWEVWRRMTTRYAFRGPDGEEIADELLGVLGGRQVVHGHSVIADQLGVLPADIDGPYEYAGGKALGIDAGLFVGGPCLVVRLGADDPAAEGDQGDRDHLEVGDPQRDADDGDAERDAGDDVPDRQPPPGDDDPHDVADH